MELIKYLLLSALCLGISCLAFRLIFVNETQFRQQRLFLIASLVLSLSLPLTGIRVDYKDIKGNEKETFLQIQTLPAGPVQESFAAAETTGLWITASFFRKTYLIITLLFILYMLFQFTTILRLYRISDKTRHCRGLILSHPRIRSPFSFFRWIFIPKGVTDREERENIILHESIHVSQYHSLDNLLTGLAAALMWFNPLIWMMRRSLHLVHEYLADEGTLGAGTDRLKYRALLINQVAEGRLICLSSGLKNSQIRKRMIMMTKSKNIRRNNIKILTLIPLLASLLIMVALLNGFFPAKAKAEASDNGATFLNIPEAVAGMAIRQDKAPETLAGITTGLDKVPETLAGITTGQAKAPETISGADPEDGRSPEPMAGMVTEQDTVRIRIAGDNNRSNSGDIKVVRHGDSLSSQKVIYIVDGIRKENITGLDPETIESVEVLKEENLIIIRTKKPEKRQVEVSGFANKPVVLSRSSSLPDNVLFVVDGRIVEKNLFEKIEPNQIIVVEVMKGKEQVRKYTDKDYEGVVVVTTREKNEW